MPSDQKNAAADGDLMVVGVDGSPASEVAIRWALNFADIFGLVQPVAVWSLPWWALTPSVSGGQPRSTSVDFVAEVESAAGRALSLIEDDRLKEATITQGPAGPTLVEASEEASLLVVGTRGRGAFADSVLGSVSSYCAAKSVVPVAIIPNSAETAASPTKAIVGIDGSQGSVDALRWAMDSLPEEIDIRVVHVWNSAANTSLEFTALPVDLIRANATRTLNQTIASARDAASNSQRRLHPNPEQGDPRSVLRELSRDIDLLVLGSRGRSGIAHLLLGSVTTALVHQPLIPTIVVPTDNVPTQNSARLAAV